MKAKQKSSQRSVALYFDLANMCKSDMDWIVRSVRRHGTPVIARAYGNFLKRRFLEAAAEKLFLKDVELIHCPGWQNGSDDWKDCADETMMDDIQQTLAERKDIGRYIVCTGDGHFLPIVKRLRASGREVIVIAPATGASRKLEEVAHKFLLAPDTDIQAPFATTPSVEKGSKLLQESQMPASRKPVTGNSRGFEQHTHPNGRPPLKKPGTAHT